MNENDELEIDLALICKALWKKAWAIVLTAVLFGGIMFAYGRATYVPRYSASVTMYTEFVDDRVFAFGDKDGTIVRNTVSEARNMVNTCVAVLNTREVLQEVISRANLEINNEQLSGMIDAKAINNTELFTVNVIDTNAERAALIANTVAQVLPEKVAMVNGSCDVSVMDSALTPTAPIGDRIKKNAALSAVLGAFLVCTVVAVKELAPQWKAQKSTD